MRAKSRKGMVKLQNFERITLFYGLVYPFSVIVFRLSVFGYLCFSFSHVLPTSLLGCYMGKSIESVVYCLNNSRMFYV